MPWSLDPNIGRRNQGRRVTAFYAIHDDVKNAGAVLVTDKRAVRDGNIITGTDPQAMPEMIKLILEAVKERSQEKA